MSDRLVNDDDLRLFLLMHRAIRGDLAALPRAVASLSPGEAARASAIAHWLEAIARAIEHHHGGEDSWVYPRLEERDPSFAKERRALEDDHRALDPALAAARTAIAALATSTRFERDRDDLVRRIEELDASMKRHLDTEEAAVVPRMKRLITRREIVEFERESARSGSLRDLALVLPWVLSYADARERAMVDAVLPWPVRLMYRWSWKQSYERISAAIHAPAAKEAA